MSSKSNKEEPDARFFKYEFSNTEFGNDLDNDSSYNKDNEENYWSYIDDCNDNIFKKIDNRILEKNNETTKLGTSVNNNNSTSFKNIETLDKEFNMRISDLNASGNIIIDHQSFNEGIAQFHTIEGDLINEVSIKEIIPLNLVQLLKEEIITISFGDKKKPFLTKKKGRKPKDFKQENVDIGKVHTKYEFRNIFKKLKRHAIENIIKYINKKLKESKNQNLNCLKILKIDNSMIIVDRIDENLELFGKKLGEIFSQKPNSRFTKDDLNDNNIEAIKKIRLENDELFNAILETTFGEVMDIFVGKSEDPNKKALFEGLKTIYDDVETFRNNGEGDVYIESYLDIGKNYLPMMKSKKQRKKKRRK